MPAGVVQDVEVLVQGYSNYLQAHQKSPRTIAEYTKIVRAWYQWWRRPVDEFDSQAWDRWLYWLTERQVKGITIRAYQSALRKFYKYLRRHKLSTQEPAKDAEPVGVAKRIPVFLSEAEVSRMYDSCDGSLRHLAMLELLYSCGLRNSELRSLKPQDITPTHIRVTGKGNKTRLVAISAKSYTAISAYVGGRKGYSYAFGRDKGSPAAMDTVQRIVANLARSAGISQRVTPHTLRHSIATHLACRGVPVERLQLFLGHEDIQTTMVYIHISKALANQTVLELHPRG